MRSRLVVMMMLVAVALCGAVPVGAADKPDGKIKIFVGILPVAYFVERVGGPHVECNVLVGPGQDPHTFDPTPKTVAKLADSRVLFTMQFPFEENLVKKVGSTFKGVEKVDLQQGIKLRTLTEEEAEAEEAEHKHGHEEAEEHDHHEAEDTDQHSWLDPQLAKVQAKTIADTLIRIDPTHKADYEENLKKFQADLDAVHERLKAALAPVKGRKFFVFHPAYGYFGDAYGLQQVAVQSAGKEPTARQLARLIDVAKEDGVKVIFAQPQFSRKSAEALAKSIGGAVLLLDDLAPDYLRNLGQMATELESALKAQKK